MFNPGSITLAELSSAVKDWGILAVIAGLGWKARGIFQPFKDLIADAKSFFVDSRVFYAAQTSQMNLLLNNHLAHLKQSEPEAEKAVVTHASGK